MQSTVWHVQIKSNFQNCTLERLNIEWCESGVKQLRSTELFVANI